MLRFAVLPYRSSLLPVAAFAAGLVVATALCQSAPTGASAPAAAELRVFDPSLIDKTIDPCETSIATVATNGSSATPARDQTSYGRFTELAELNRLRLKQILEETAAPAPRAVLTKIRRAETSKKSAPSTPVAWTQPR